MTDKQLKQLERELAELETLLGEVDTTAEKVRTVPVKEGIEMLELLDTELRPFIIRYTALINRTKQYVPIEPNKLAKFIPLAERLSNCEELTLATYGTCYLTAIDMVLNGVGCRQEHVTDIETLTTFLFYEIQLTADATDTINLFIYSEGSLSGIFVEKEEDAE
jgi:hypothetical protein